MKTKEIVVSKKICAKRLWEEANRIIMPTTKNIYKEENNGWGSNGRWGTKG
jgi:hypothetical protein